MKIVVDPKPVPNVVPSITRTSGAATLLECRLMTGSWIKAAAMKLLFKKNMVAIQSSVCNYIEDLEHIRFELCTDNMDIIPLSLKKSEAIRLAKRILQDNA